LTLPDIVGSDAERKVFLATLERHFGFKVLREYTGEANSLDDKEGHHFSNWTVVCHKAGQPNLNGLDLTSLILSRRQIPSGPRKSPKSDIGASNKSKGYIHKAFEIQGNVVNFGSAVPSAPTQDERIVKTGEIRNILQQFYYENNGSLMRLTAQQAQSIKELGIEINFAPVKGKLHFFFQFADQKADGQAIQIFPVDQEGNMVAWRYITILLFTNISFIFSVFTISQFI